MPARSRLRLRPTMQMFLGNFQVRDGILFKASKLWCNSAGGAGGCCRPRLCRSKRGGVPGSLSHLARLRVVCTTRLRRRFRIILKIWRRLKGPRRNCLKDFRLRFAVPSFMLADSADGLCPPPAGGCCGASVGHSAKAGHGWDQHTARAKCSEDESMTEHLTTPCAMLCAALNHL